LTGVVRTDAASCKTHATSPLCPGQLTSNFGDTLH
jgi:hypothetical protein